MRGATRGAGLGAVIQAARDTRAEEKRARLLEDAKEAAAKVLEEAEEERWLLDAAKGAAAKHLEELVEKERPDGEEEFVDQAQRRWTRRDVPPDLTVPDTYFSSYFRSLRAQTNEDNEYWA